MLSLLVFPSLTLTQNTSRFARRIANPLTLNHNCKCVGVSLSLTPSLTVITMNHSSIASPLNSRPIASPTNPNRGTIMIVTLASILIFFLADMMRELSYL